VPDLEIIFKTKAELAGAIAAKEALEHQLGAAKALGQATTELEAKIARINQTLAQHAAAAGQSGFGHFLAELGEQALKAIPGLEAAAGALAKLARAHQQLTAQAQTARTAGENQPDGKRALERGQNILAPTTRTHTGEQAESVTADATAEARTATANDLPQRQLERNRQAFQGNQPPEPAETPADLDSPRAEEQKNRGVPTASVSQAIESAADTVTGQLQDLRQQLQAFFADMTKTLSAIQADVKATQDWIATHLS